MSDVLKIARELQKQEEERDLFDLSQHKASEMLYQLSGKLKYKAYKAKNNYELDKSQKLNQAANLLDEAIKVLKNI